MFIQLVWVDNLLTSKSTIFYPNK